MKLLKLPQELVSLVHYVELNKSGWWNQSIQRLVISVIWLLGRPLSLKEVTDELKNNFKVNIRQDIVEKQLEALISSRILVPLPEGVYKIAETELRKYQQDLAEADKNEEESKKIFLQQVAIFCPSLESEPKIWDSFNERFLLPLVQQLGADVYQLLSGDKIELERPLYEEYLRSIPSEFRSSFSLAVKRFIDPKNINIRSYILRVLNAYFFLAATGLKESSLEFIEKMTNSQAKFNVFTDTNFLFSILGIHENPSNEAALYLTDLITKLSKKVVVKLYVLPITVKEAKAALIHTKNYYGSMRITVNVAEVILEKGIDTGIANKFLEEVVRSGSSLTADQYFSPYTTDLLRIARSKKIDLFNPPADELEKYKTDQRVVNDILEQQNFEKGKKTPKSYEQLDHDITLWHFVHDKRPSEVESPIDAKCWVVTVDFRFLGYDKYKINVLGESVPICISPTSFIQMLQFWVPRSEAMEEAIMGSMKLASIFPEFGAGAERVTIKIIDTLGRYENAGDIPKETVAAILLNDALRGKISAETNTEKQSELVKEELIAQHKKLSDIVVSQKETIQRIGKRLEAKDKKIEDLGAQSKFHEEREKLGAKQLKEFKRLVKTGQNERDSLFEKVRRLESNQKLQDKEDKRTEEISLFSRKFIYLPLLAFFLIIPAFSYLSEKLLRFKFLGCLLILSSFYLLIWVFIFDRAGVNNKMVSNWKIFRKIHDFKKHLSLAFIFTSILGLLQNIFANAIWEWLR